MSPLVPFQDPAHCCLLLLCAACWCCRWCCCHDCIAYAAGVDYRAAAARLASLRLCAAQMDAVWLNDQYLTLKVRGGGVCVCVLCARVCAGGEEPGVGVLLLLLLWLRLRLSS